MTDDVDDDRPSNSAVADWSHGPVDPEARRARTVCWIVFLTTIGLLVTHGASEHALGRLFDAVRHTTVERTTADGAVAQVSITGLPRGPLADGRPIDGYDPRLVGATLTDGSRITAVELGLGEGSMMIAAALAMGCVVLLLRREKARELVERRVDWWTLTFFMMLFASVGTLEHTGVTRVIADTLIAATGDNPAALITVVGWSTGWLSAFLDNVLAVATFMPVIEDVRIAWADQNPASPGYPAAIYWLMLFGGTFMGNMTVIGSTANIIAVGVLEKCGHGTVRFGEWFKIGLIVSLVSMLIATVMLGAQTEWFTTPLLPAPHADAAADP